MSTKTTFKRIALVAVAALGLGVLSVAPSSAQVSNTTLSVTDGAAVLRAGATSLNSDSSTNSAVITVGALHDSTDTLTVTFYEKSIPSGATSTAATAKLGFLETTTPAASSTTVGKSSTITTYTAATSWKTDYTDSLTASSVFSVSRYQNAAGVVGAKFLLSLDSATAGFKAGTYTFTVVVKAYSAAGASANATTTTTADVNIVVSANAVTTAAASTTPSSLKSYAVLSTSSSDPGNVADASITSVSTASATPAGYVYVAVRNAADAQAAVDSVTATITGAGVLSLGGVTGSSFKVAATGDQVISILPDGRAGVATISITTSVTTYSAKTVTFYAKSAKTITATVNYPTLAVGANTGAVAVSAVDANGTNWTGQAYIVASSAADALVAGSTTPVACAAYNTTDGILCPVTAAAAGTAKFKVIDASTVAAATATSNEVTLRASAATANTVKIAFDKSTYAPFEKAKITVTPVDVAGNLVKGQTLSNLFATGGITSTIGFSSNSDTLTAVSITTDPTTGAASYTVYMPAASGDVTISATGGTSLPAAGQVKVSATASVVNASVDAATDAANEATDAANAATDAALAAADAADAATAAAQDASDAVAALSASVSKLISSLRAQITSLTNLVIKIQKKVKA
jgi:hypothetical protein